jgi:signal transduction histidine kinase
MNNAKDALIQNVNNGDRLIFITTKKIDENSLELRICDNGGGISKDIIQRIFEPYFTTKHKSIGTGLGLSIVDKIIRERHEQTVKVHNESFKHEGKDYIGACFSIVFTKK